MPMGFPFPFCVYVPSGKQQHPPKSSGPSKSAKASAPRPSAQNRQPGFHPVSQASKASASRPTHPSKTSQAPQPRSSKVAGPAGRMQPGGPHQGKKKS